MKPHTAEIDPSEDEREKLIELLRDAQEKVLAKEHEIEVLLKKGNKKVLDPDSQKEAEMEVKRCRRNSETLDDIISKSEFTRGHTLKKAYNKKTLHMLKDTVPDDKYKTLEEILSHNGLA